MKIDERFALNAGVEDRVDDEVDDKVDEDTADRREVSFSSACDLTASQTLGKSRLTHFRTWLSWKRRRVVRKACRRIW